LTILNERIDIPVMFQNCIISSHIPFSTAQTLLNFKDKEKFCLGILAWCACGVVLVLFLMYRNLPMKTVQQNEYSPWNHGEPSSAQPMRTLILALIQRLVIHFDVMSKYQIKINIKHCSQNL
jgi:hydrogenase-4 membrane subunit HyfE